MSKKQQQISRLNSLFSGLEPPAAAPVSTPRAPEVPAGPVPLSGWAWELDASGCYISCSDDILLGLGFAPAEFIGQAMSAFRLDPLFKASLDQALKAGFFPSELTIQFRHGGGQSVPVRLNILTGPTPDSPGVGWRGFAQVLPQEEWDLSDTRPFPGTVPVEFSPKVPTFETASNGKNGATKHHPTVLGDETSPQETAVSREPIQHFAPVQGVRIDAFGAGQASQPLTPLGQAALAHHEATASSGGDGQPAALAVSVQAGELGDLLIEMVDDLQDRPWTEDERQMVSEVADQLALALENARLYIAAQQELAERVRAEKTILQRNQDLATLNQIGQRLNRLVSSAEIFATLGDLIEQVTASRNYYFYTRELPERRIAFPLCVEDGQPSIKPEKTLAARLPEVIIHANTPLLLTAQVEQNLAERGIEPPERIPTALIAIPMVAGETLSGALVIQDYANPPAPNFDDAHMEMLSTAVTQAATALENARLFEQMQQGLNAIEKRERYQAGVAQAAGHLSEFGSESLKEVLEYIGHASQVGRVYLMEYIAQDTSSHWRLVEQWVAPEAVNRFDSARIQTIPFEIFSTYINSIRTHGWIEIQADENTAAGIFLRAQSIDTALALHVPAKGAFPNLLIFDQLDQPRIWQSDEINILQVAADAVANTYIREDLLVQLQMNLEETASLYKATNQFVLSGNFQDMLSALMETVASDELNRAMMVLFERSESGYLTEVAVHANWYSGKGTRPPYVGSLLPVSVYERFLTTLNPVFLDSTLNSSADKVVRSALYEQNIHAVAMLPMWSGKRQIGALLVAGDHKHSFTGRESRILPPLTAQLTIAVENLRLFEQTQSALSETALLYNVSSGIAQSISADDMIQLVVDNVMPHGADKAAIMLAELDINSQIANLEVVAFHDTNGRTKMKGRQIKIEELPALRQLGEDGLSIPDINSTDAVSRAMLQSLGVKSIVFTPMRSGGRLVGLLAFACHKSLHFLASDLRIIRTVANGVAVALEKQRLLRQAERRALELQTASEIARDTTSTLSLDLLLNSIVNLLGERFGYYHTSIFFIDDAHTYANLRESSGSIGAELKRRGHRVQVGSRSIVGAVSASGEIMVINDVSTSSKYLPHSLLPDTQAEMALPLRIGNRITGVLDIQSKTTNAFLPDDVNVLSILTDQIAIAIENARAYELAQKAIADMREVDRVKSQFLANMSHELRTPLNSIIGFSRVILKGIDGPVNETQQQDLTAIYNSGQHLLMLINDILDLSKIEAGKMDLSFSEANLAEIIASVMSTATGLVKDKPITLNTQVAPNLPSVLVDPTRIRQVLINFLSNAAKFTDEGAITVEAVLSQTAQGQPEILVTVTDTGPGIAEKDRVKLFLPFSQVDDSPTRKTGGTGLGLSICRSLIELHNGRIGLLRSEVGQGSTFFFSLPVQTTQIPEPTRQVQESDLPMVLAIDDDKQVISLYQRFLKPQGYIIMPLTDPTLAVETARRVQPAVITLDVLMPKRDGWQVLKDLKDDPLTRSIPVILCSLLQEEEKGYDLGAAGYLMKPFLQDALVKTIQRVLKADHSLRVLIIDDEPAELDRTAALLASYPRFEINKASSGQAGLDFCQEITPDLIILDLSMPEMDGFAVLAELSADPALAHVPLVLLRDADLDDAQRAEATSAGKRLLDKAARSEEKLLEEIEQALNRVTAPVA